MKKVKAYNEATGQWEMIAQGKDGKTPEKGVDYWTEEDINSIKEYCRAYIDNELLGGES